MMACCPRLSLNISGCVATFSVKRPLMNVSAVDVLVSFCFYLPKITFLYRFFLCRTVLSIALVSEIVYTIHNTFSKNSKTIENYE